MKTGRVYSYEINLSKIMKPSFFLNEGKRSFVELKRQNLINGILGDIVKSVYRPGIFKRIFVKDQSFGSHYFTASDMMKSEPLRFAKYLSNKLTDNAEYMKVFDKMILVSCAGTVGNVRLIDKTLDGKIASQDIIRVEPNNDNYGFVYAYLNTKTVYKYIISLIYGSVVDRIEPSVIFNLPLASLSSPVIKGSHELIVEAKRLREEATEALEEAQKMLKHYANLPDLTEEDYDYFGPHAYGREVSCFVRKRKDINALTINAFNHSERIRSTKQKITCETKPLKDVLVGNTTFSTGSFPRVEVKEGNGIMLINQSDIFDTIVKGKHISKRNIKATNLVEYGEVLIAGVGTLGENETFCRTIYAYEDLVGQLISGEFIRMKTNNDMPSGYLYAWLSSDYGFRLIRNLQAGTKLCRPIPKLLLELHVPIINEGYMYEIDKTIKTAHTKIYQANKCERQAIHLVESAIEQWNKN